MHTGHILMYVVCPVLWCSNLQTEIVLITTESEYIALSETMCNKLTLMALLKEVPFINIHLPNPKNTIKVVLLCHSHKGSHKIRNIIQSNILKASYKKR